MSQAWGRVRLRDRESWGSALLGVHRLTLMETLDTGRCDSAPSGVVISGGVAAGGIWAEMVTADWEWDPRGGRGAPQAAGMDGWWMVDGGWWMGEAAQKMARWRKIAPGSWGGLAETGRKDQESHKTAWPRTSRPACCHQDLVACLGLPRWLLPIPETRWAAGPVRSAGGVVLASQILLAAKPAPDPQPFQASKLASSALPRRWDQASRIPARPIRARLKGCRGRE